MPDDSLSREESPEHPWRPVPDPTTLTTEALLRAVQAERDYVNLQIRIIETRLDGMDRATALLDTQVHRVPTDIQREIGHIKELHEQRFSQLAEALTVALATAKESVAAQDSANQKAIDKAESATTERIEKQEQLFRSEHNALVKLVDETRGRLTVVESSHTGGAEAAATGRANLAIIFSAMMMVVAIATVVIVVVK